MFEGCISLRSVDMTNLDMSNVTDMSGMFVCCHDLEEVDFSAFSTPNVSDLNNMFSCCHSLSSITFGKGFNTSCVTNMSYMFNQCHSLKSLDVSVMDTRSVENMEEMFSSCDNLTKLDLSNFNTRRVRTMEGMFVNCKNLKGLDVSSFNTRNVSNMYIMFAGCRSLTSLDLSNFDTEYVFNMSGMFNSCAKLTFLDISGFVTNRVNNMSCMFMDCQELRRIYADEFSVNREYIRYANEDKSMFRGCSKLTGGSGTVYDEDHIDSEYARIDGGETAPGYFTYKKSIANKCYSFNSDTGVLTLKGKIDKNEIDTDCVRNIELNKQIKKIVADDTAVLPEKCYALLSQFKSVTEVDLSKADCTNVTDITYFIYDCPELVTVDISGFYNSAINKMAYAFAKCPKLETIYASKYLDLQDIGYDNYVSSAMFIGCNSLVGGNGTKYDSAHTDSEYAREDLGSDSPGYFTVRRSVNFDSETKTLYINEGFKKNDFEPYLSIAEHIVVSDWISLDTCYSLFSGFEKVKDIDLRKASFANVTNMTGMFENCSKLEKVIFRDSCYLVNTDKVIHMSNMFNGCSSLTDPGITYLRTPVAYDMVEMFSGC